MKLDERAKEVQESRNEKWQDAWHEADLTTLVDVVNWKLNRAWNLVQMKKELLEDFLKSSLKERYGATVYTSSRLFGEIEGSLVDGYNYLKELKRRLKNEVKLSCSR